MSSTDFIKSAISFLDTNAFPEFILRLWKDEDCNTEELIIDTYKLPRIGKNVFEQIRIKKQYNEVASRSYNLIIPYQIPTELLIDPYPELFLTNDVFNKLKKYKRVLDKRVQEWQWMTHGEYLIPNIAFVNNYLYKPESYYQKCILQLHEVLQNMDIAGNPVMGSSDSFIQLSKNTTEKVFKEFFSEYRKDIVVSINDGIKINEFVSEKYLSSGVLRYSLTPIETINITTSKNQILHEFEYLINENKNERELQRFIQRNYRLVFGEHFNRIETEVWLKCPEADILGKERRLDLFLRNSISNDWELFELKRANKIISSYRNDIPKLSTEFYGAVQQLENYQKLLNQDKIKRLLAKEGIEYFEPELRLVIGRKPQIDTQLWRTITKRNEKGFKLMTWDDLLNELRLRVNSRF